MNPALAFIVAALALITLLSGCMVGVHLGEARWFTRRRTRWLYYGFASLDALTCAVCAGVSLYLLTL